MERITTGIEGLDQMLAGGIPRAHMVTVTGPPGAGKTILGLQFTSANLAAGRRCALLSASDPPESVLENAEYFGFRLREAHQRGQLVVEKPEAGEMERGMSSDYLTRLMRLIESIDSEVLVIDSLTEFADLSGSDMERRGRVAHLRSLLRRRGITAISTAEAAPEGDRSRYPEIDYVADGWVLLRRIQSNNLSETLHVMQVMKMKWTKHSREIRAYDITDRGLEVYAKYSVIV